MSVPVRFEIQDAGQKEKGDAGLRIKAVSQHRVARTWERKRLEKWWLGSWELTSATNGTRINWRGASHNTSTRANCRVPGVGVLCSARARPRESVECIVCREGSSKSNRRMGPPSDGARTGMPDGAGSQRRAACGGRLGSCGGVVRSLWAPLKLAPSEYLAW